MLTVLFSFYLFSARLSQAQFITTMLEIVLESTQNNMGRESLRFHLDFLFPAVLLVNRDYLALEINVHTIKKSLIFLFH